MMDPGPVMVVVGTDPALPPGGDVMRARGTIATPGRAGSPVAAAKAAEEKLLEIPVPRSREREILSIFKVCTLIEIDLATREIFIFSFRKLVAFIISNIVSQPQPSLTSNPNFQEYS